MTAGTTRQGTQASPDPDTRVVVLAAGQGLRFGGEGHKALAPLVEGRGTLELLLRQLTAAGVGHVTIVTGAHREGVEELIGAVAPGATTVHNTAFAGSTPLQSLACAVREDQSRDTWVLLADTVYSSAFAGATWGVPHDGAALAVHRPERPAGIAPTESDVPVDVVGGRVMGLGTRFGRRYEMAPAVRWPTAFLPAILAGADEGLARQWQVLARLCGDAPSRTGEPIAAIEVSARDHFDIDTPADLASGAQRLR